MAIKAGRCNRTAWKRSGRQALTADAHNSPAGMFKRALSLHQSGRLAEAEDLYRQILQFEPGHADALHLLGVTAYQRGNNSLAVEYIEKATGIDSAVPYYHNNLGSALMNLGEAVRAEHCFNEALRLKPDYSEAWNNLGNSVRVQGRDDEAMTSYKRSIELNSEFVPAINNIANLLKDRGEFDDAIRHYHKAISLQPDLAETYYNLGNALKESGRPDEAVEQYRRAISLNPDFAEAHNNLGNVLKKKKRYEEAVRHYNRAMTLKPALTEAYTNLSDAYREQGRFDEAVEQCKRALILKPDFELAYVNLGNIFLDKGNYSDALAYNQKAIDIKPDFKDAHFNKGIVLLLRGEFNEGWKEYEWRFHSKEILKDIGYTDMKIPLWDGSPLEGKTILIKSEQGIGDHIQFIRYAPLVKERGGRVIYECHKELMRLFEGHSGIDVLIEKPYTSGCAEDPDTYVYLLSLPGVFGTTLDNIPAGVPYPGVDKHTSDGWNERFDKKMFNVGLVWSGDPGHRNDRNRSCRLSDLTPLADVSGVALYSLQKDGPGVIPAGMKITDLGTEFNDFYDTAAAIENMDLVISVDTSVAHLAGAMGKTVWTLLPFIPDWRWMIDREDTPWYPAMRLFRQQRPGDWQSVINRVVYELKESVNLKGVMNELKQNG
ncbi:MAG: tetratricopeptide repeat protein [Nitrospirota bacterium]|nr:tetratricopeptide repeat protein [Nitrospirota bacterium]